MKTKGKSALLVFTSSMLALTLSAYLLTGCSGNDGDVNEEAVSAQQALYSIGQKADRIDSWIDAKWSDALNRNAYAEAYALASYGETKRWESIGWSVNADESYPRVTIHTQSRSITYAYSDDGSVFDICAYVTADRENEDIFVSYSTSQGIFHYALFINRSSEEADNPNADDSAANALSLAESNGNVQAAALMREILALADGGQLADAQAQQAEPQAPAVASEATPEVAPEATDTQSDAE